MKQIVLYLLVVSSVSRVEADEGAYWKAKAASAIAIRVTSLPAVPTTVTANRKDPAKPVVELYTAVWCAPCQRAKAELKALEKTLPFAVKLTDVDKSGWPAGTDSIPHFEWESPKGRLYAKWNGAADLIARWELSQK